MVNVTTNLANLRYGQVQRSSMPPKSIWQIGMSQGPLYGPLMMLKIHLMEGASLCPKSRNCPSGYYPIQQRWALNPAVSNSLKPNQPYCYAVFQPMVDSLPSQQVLRNTGEQK